MRIIETIRKGITGIIYTGLVAIIHSIFLYRIFPRMTAIPSYIGYFLTAVTGIIWILGIITIILGEQD